MSEAQEPTQENQAPSDSAPLKLAVRPTIVNNRPIASNRDENIEDFVGYMD